MLISSKYSHLTEAGIDEAGRGSLAGPVFAAAVILPAGFEHPKLNDSKKMTSAHRYALRQVIENTALAWCVAFIDAAEIDRINILNATYKAMHKAIDGLKITPQMLLVDGNRFKPYKAIKHECIVKGDGIYAAIAAASVLAKTHRDSYMQHIHNEFPCYNWQSNKGYGTSDHVSAMRQYGQCIYHRKSFVLKSNQLQLDL